MELRCRNVTVLQYVIVLQCIGSHVPRTCFNILFCLSGTDSGKSGALNIFSDLAVFTGNRIGMYPCQIYQFKLVTITQVQMLIPHFTATTVCVPSENKIYIEQELAATQRFNFFTMTSRFWLHRIHLLHTKFVLNILINNFFLLYIEPRLVCHVYQVSQTLIRFNRFSLLYVLSCPSIAFLSENWDGWTSEGQKPRNSTPKSRKNENTELCLPTIIQFQPERMYIMKWDVFIF